MQKPESTREALFERIRTLEERLWEAEQTIEAIRSGEVDALVVQRHDGEQLYTLTGADHGYRILVESITEGALILSSDNSIYYCNRTLGDMLGLPLQKIVGTKLSSYVVAEARGQLTDLITESRSRGATRGELLMRRNDGTLLPINVSLNSMSVEGFEGVCAVVTDLSDQKRVEEELKMHRTRLESLVDERTTDLVRKNAELQQEIIERKRVEDALHQSEERLRFHRERMPIGCIVHDEELRFVELNPAAERILGYRAEELIGQHVRVIVPPEARPHVDGILRRLAAGDMTAHSVNENLTRDGRIILCDWMNTPLKDSDGKLLGLLSMVQDVTERKRAEDMLRESEARYRELVQHANSAIIRWRADGTITFFNEYAQDFFGWSAAEIMGEHVSVLVPEQESTGADLTILVQDIVDHPDLYVNNVNENVCRDGRRVWMTWTNRAVRDESGRVTEILAIGSDITDRTRGEEALRESESRFRLLSKTASRLLEAEDPLRVVSELAREIMEHLDCQAFFNFVADDRVGRLHLNAFAGIPDEEAQRIEWLDYGVAVCGCVARDGVRIVAEDICSIADPRTELVKSYGILAYACHPLMAEGKVIGTLSFGTKMRSSFSPQDLDLMKTVADQVAVAMERMRLVAEIERSRNELEARVETRTAQLAEANQELQKTARALIGSEKKLHRNIELLQKVFDGITDPLLMLDDSGLVTMINKAAMNYYGVEEGADLLGRPCYEGLRGKEAACPECNHPFLLAGTRTMSFERSGLNDPERVENVTVYPVLDKGGRRDAVIVRINDITQAKILEKQILQNEKLAALGLVTSGIAHEINNPNSFIYFNLPILRSYLEELMPIVDEYAALHHDFQVLNMSYGEFREDMFRLLENMEHGSERISRIVGVLKSFVRRKESEGMQRVDLKQLVDKVVALCHTELRHKVSSHEILVPDGLPSIVSDPEALEQVLLNLLINAIHACDKPDSHVILKVESNLPGGDECIIEITDNGSGIDETLRERIFDPFFTTKASSKGTGLGLYICHNRVASLGGRIEVESKVGRGTTFRVVLPQEGKGRLEDVAAGRAQYKIRTCIMVSPGAAFMRVNTWESTE